MSLSRSLPSDWSAVRRHSLRAPWGRVEPSAAEGSTPVQPSRICATPPSGTSTTGPAVSASSQITYRPAGRLPKIAVRVGPGIRSALVDAGMDPASVVVNTADLDLATPETLAWSDHERSEAAADVEGDAGACSRRPDPDFCITGEPR